MTASNSTPATQRTELVKLLALFLEGAACATWKQLVTANRVDLIKIQTELRRAYGKSKTV